MGCTDASLPGRQPPRRGAGVGLVLPDEVASACHLGGNGKVLSKTARERFARERRKHEHVEEERRLLHATVARSRGRGPRLKKRGGRTLMIGGGNKVPIIISIEIVLVIKINKSIK